MAWLSPAYPVGAFSYSGGIEWAVEAGDIKDAETLRRWLAVMLGEGGGFCDARVFRSCAPRDAAAPTMRRCTPSPSLPPPSCPRRSAFWKRRRKAAPSSTRRARRGHVRRWTHLAGRVERTGRAADRGRRRVRRPWHRLRDRAAGLSACAGRQLDFRRRAAYSARPDRRPARPGGARTDDAATAARARSATPLDEIGSCAFRADLASMRHETQYTRLFRAEEAR